MSNEFGGCVQKRSQPKYRAKIVKSGAVRRTFAAKRCMSRVNEFAAGVLILLLVCLVFVQGGCRSASKHRKDADKVASEIIAEKQQEALGRTEAFGIKRSSNVLRRRLLEEQRLDYSGPWSLGTDRLEKPEHWPKDNYPDDVNVAENSVMPIKYFIYGYNV